MLHSRAAAAGERYALVITGASGRDVYAQKYQKWCASFTATLREKFGYAAIGCSCSRTRTARARRSPRARMSGGSSEISDSA